jgi:hypothetical protein
MPKKDNMTLDKIVAIAGRPGLFEMVAQSRSGIIARSLVDGKRISSPINNQISVMTEIQIFCIGGEMPLTEVFDKIIAYEKGAIARISPKANKIDLEAYFFEIIDNYDEERVYPSDIKKIIQWYNILVSSKVIGLSEKKNKKATAETSTKENDSEQ